MNPVEHLSEEELDDLLIGAASATASAHAASCPECGARAAAFRSSVSSFKQASFAWSEAKSNTISRDLSGHRGTPGFGRAVRWSLAAAVPAVFAAVLFFAPHPEATEPVPVANAVGTHIDRESEIAGDNAMLQAINSEIDRPDPSPVQVYSLAKTPSGPVQRSAAREVMD